MNLDEAIGHLGQLLQNHVLQLDEALQRVATSARIDQLTGLQNGVALEERLKEALDTDTPRHFFFADLNGFKDINDKHSHEAGNAALRIFSEKLSCIAKIWSFQIFRISGDEFALLVSSSKLDSVVIELSKAFSGFRIPFEDDEFDLSASFGYVDIKDCDAITLKQRAEMACAEAKYSEPHRVVVEWTNTLERKIVSRRFRCKACSASVKCEVPVEKAEVLNCPACGTRKS